MFCTRSSTEKVHHWNRALCRYIWWGTGALRPRLGAQWEWMVSLRSIVSLSVNLLIENKTVCSSMEVWMGCDISSIPFMVYDNGMKILLNDTVPKKLTYLKIFILSCIRS